MTSDSTDSNDDSEEIGADEKYARWMYGIGALICCVTIGIFTYIEFKVIKKVGKSDKVIPTMLLMLQFSALSTS